jgi:hypothetical protein
MTISKNRNDREFEKFRDRAGKVSVSVTNDNFIYIIDSSGGTTYVGEALPSSLTSSPVWKITRITKAGSIDSILLADSGEFTQIWNNRASLIYG